MFEIFIERENTVFDILQKFRELNLEFVVIGGLAVSAYKHRFSVDGDLVIPALMEEKFVKILEQHNFKETIMKEFEDIYSSRFRRFVKQDNLPVSIDLMINAVGIRQTGAFFHYPLLRHHSNLTKIKGVQREIIVFVPCREILIVLKLHSGRARDLRDVAALTKSLDFELIQQLLIKYKSQLVKKHIQQLLSLINTQNFIDSFKGVFIEKEYDLDLDEILKFNQLKFNDVESE